jgi:hypothetical protein
MCAQLKRRVFEHDWSTAARKHGLQKRIDKESKDFPAEAKAASTMDELRAATFVSRELVYGMYAYYSCATTGPDVFSVSKQAFIQMTEEVHPSTHAA